MKLMEGDFDPDKFEELMKETYGDDYYEQEDPEWKDDQDVRENLKSGEDGALLVGQDDPDGGLYDNVEEAEYEDGDEGNGGDEEEWPEEEEYYEDDQEMPQESELEQKVKAKMMDELYKLDYEDIVAGMPTRFKYRQVEKNSYGLSTEEILFARDSTLKQFVSLKKLAPYREQGEHFTDSRRRRKFREMLQRDLEEDAALAESGKQQRDGSQPEELEADSSGNKKKRRRLKKGNRKDEGSEETDEKATKEDKTKETSDEKTPDEDKTKETEADDSTEEPKAKKRRRRKNKKVEESDSQPVAEEKVVLNEKTEAEKELSKAKRKEKKEKQKGKKEKEKKKGKKTSIEGVPESRLASYGL
jgi:protein KRI1